MNIIKITLAVLSVTATSLLFAADGTITFNGLLVTGTCSPTVTSGGSAPAINATVTLPTLNITSLSAANTTAGATAFSILLNGGTGSDGCINGGKVGTPYFEPEVSKINSQGRIINTGTATNVDIQILNNAQQVINLSQDASSQLTSTGTVATTVHTYNYFARYFATEATGAGPVTGSVSYSIIYK